MKSILCILIVFFCLNAPAQNFSLLKDINTCRDANPLNYINDIYLENDSVFNVFYTGNSKYAVIGSVVYFAADDGIHGTELWRSDTTGAGTYMVKDISPGSASSEVQSLTVVGNKLYFTSNRIVWVSDGTANGTYEVPGITYTSDITTCLTAVGNTLYFFTNVSRLWKTDGTLAGTSMIVDFYQTYNYAKGFLGQLTNVNGTVFFTLGYDNDYGAELWKSDGTTSGTVMVKDIFPGITGSGPLHLTPVNGKLYFSANDGTGVHLWVSDGTTNGTMMALNNNGIKLQHDGVYPFTVVNNVLCFKGATSIAGYELCIYNTTGNKSITLVKDINAGSNSSNPSNITAAANKIFFTANNAAGNEQLWISDGTPSGTKRIKTGEAGSKFSNFSYNNGILLFSYSNVANGNELWKSDGTVAGTELVKDIYAGANGAYPAYTTYVSGAVSVVSANNGSKGIELWRTNGTASGTVLVQNINNITTANSDPNLYDRAYLNGKLFFNAHEPQHENELYTSDGTTPGTQLVKDLNPAGGSNPANFIVFKKAVYFSGNNGVYQTIFKSDGTAAGTQEVFNIGNSNGIVNKIVAGTNGFYILFFNTDSSRQELWGSDGTLNGSYRLQVLPGYYTGAAATVGNILYFGENDLLHGAELWKATGTTGSATLLKDINPGSGSSYPQGFYAFNNKIYFSAFDSTNHNYIYVSNGKASGTQVLKKVNIDGLLDATQEKGRLFFRGRVDDTGPEPYISDGTSAGTYLLKDIIPGPQGSSPYSFIVLDSSVYFFATDDSFQSGLWKTDGTNSGTVLVTPVSGGFRLTVAAGKLYFTAYDNFSNFGLWVSNGEASGTYPVDDAGLAGVSISSFTGTANELFINGVTYSYGYELYAGLSPNTSPRNTDNLSKENPAPRIFQAYLTANPVKDQVKFNVVANNRQSLELSITDMNGKVLMRDTKTINQGINSFTYPAAAWAPGMYLLRLSTGDGSVASLKFVK